jgi:hypothetical protein
MLLQLKWISAAGLRGTVAGALLAALAACQPAEQPAAVAEAAGPPDLSGYWELRADSKRVSPAPVTEEGKKRAAAFRPDVEGGVILTHASRWCQHLGTPFIMGDSAPLNILQTKNEIGIIAEVQSAARHIYMDGRSMPDPDVFDPTTNGFSIGRWEGDTLVVETQGFNDLGNPGIPGGGVRGPGSKLTERFQLKENGQQLSVTFTWEDPEVFTQPHTYEFVYYKAPPETYALEYFCDASDPLRPKTAEEPPQAP